MLRRLRALDRMDEAAFAGPAPRRSHSLTNIHSERVRTAVIVAVVALIGAVCIRYAFFGGFEPTHRTVTLNANSANWPDRPFDAADLPLGRPPEVDSGAGSYQFIAMQSDGDTPLTFDPCVPIHLVVNERTAIPDANRIVSEAIDEIESATGLTFVLDGTTSETPSKKRQAQVDQYGKGWAPVLLAWSDADESPSLAGGTAGVGGSIGVARNGHRWFVTGAVTLDGPQLARLAKSPGGEDSARAVVMHELGHVVGLDHVNADHELMQPEGSPDLTSWGPGDRAGLAALGRGACVDY